MLKLTSADSTMGSIPIWSRIRILLLLINKFSECFIIHDSWVKAWGLFQQEAFRHGLHHRNFLAWGYFGTRSFWHRCTCAKMSVQKCLYCFAQCQNVHVLKHPCAEMSQCRNISVPKCPWCQNKPMLKCSHDKMSSCWKVPVMKCLCRNVSCQNVRCRNKPKTSIPEVIRR